MFLQHAGVKMVFAGLGLILLTGCFKPPYNNFQEDKRSAKYIALGTGVGATVGTVAGVIVGSAATGAAIGGLTGALIGYQKTTRRNLLHEIQQQGIQYIQYGDTSTLIVPTDRYFDFNSPKLNDICYPGLINIIRLLRYYPDSMVYVAAFTDNIGTKHHKKNLTQARAETMLTFLWANNIKAEQLHAEGYADKYDIGDNKLIRGSAYNRRIEIQWFHSSCKEPCLADAGWK